MTAMHKPQQAAGPRPSTTAAEGGLGARLDELRKDGTDAVNKAADQIGQTYDQAQRKAVESFEDMEAAIRRNPMTSVAIAAGVGVFLGIMARR